MTPQILKKNNSKLNSMKNAAFIKYKLSELKLSFSDIAHDLEISNAAVSRSIYGKSKITRVDEWLRDNLGLEVVNG